MFHISPLRAGAVVAGLYLGNFGDGAPEELEHCCMFHAALRSVLPVSSPCQFREGLGRDWGMEWGGVGVGETPYSHCLQA